MICGIDLGSRSVKLVLLAEGTVAAEKVLETVDFYRTYGRRSEGELAIDFAALGLGAVDEVVATGYGRNTLDIANATVIPELKAHALGAVWQTGMKDFTLLDLGGQDSKVIKVRRGRMVDFQTNDKCAASTGRYLENMAAVLGISLDELSRYSENPVELSATCAIFGESELIGRIVEGYSVAELAAGVNYTIFKRVRPMLAALPSETVVFTGGVALGGALRRIIEQEMGTRVVVPERPQLNGAIGAAVYAWEKREKYVARN
ncbi:MAG TPA: acyl-CoA dehydratase activase [Selenomonadales bacterium]|nr:acyl-CoA dehydratase activase [Selenomonadales bacterium]